jgi:radical SAM protein with 4Fe4S-binding SPASM domain
MSGNVKYISIEVVKNIVSIMKNTGMEKCILIGGEPTLHPNFIEIMEMVAEIDWSISLVTNGRQFKTFEKIQKLERKPKFNLVLSVHGWSEESYFENTGSKVGFSDLMRSISFLRKNHISFGINVVLSRYTEGKIDEIILFLKSIGIKTSGFNIASPIVSKNGVNPIAVSEMKSYHKQVMEVFYECKKNDIKARFLLIVPHCIFSKEEMEMLEKSDSIANGCHVIRGAGIVFKTNGGIATCTHLSDFEIAKPDKAQEILKSTITLKNYWNSKELENTRMMANCYRSVECQTCERWSSCGGGCLVHWAYHKPQDIGLTPLQNTN